MNLKQLLIEHGISHMEGDSHRHVRQGWIGLDCPWCGTTGKWHLGVHLGSLAATCWRCGRRDLAEALSRTTSLPEHEVRGKLRGIEKSRKAVGREHHARGRLHRPNDVGRLSRPHRRYLEGRGFDPDALARLWDLQGIGVSSELSWRIWIPVWSDGELASWTTRSIGSEARRYVHARPEQEVWPIKSLLYGWDYVRHAVVICEGPTDVWRIGPGAVAVFGSNATVSQLRSLAGVPRRVVCFDGEPEARRSARRLVEQLSPFPGDTLSVELDSADPGEATDDEVARLRKFLD